MRQAVAFWRDMDTRAKTGDLPLEPPDFMSTHPAHGDRAQLLDAQLDAALQLRQACNCPPLPRHDPRVDAEARSVLAERRLIDAGRL